MNNENAKTPSLRIAATCCFKGCAQAALYMPVIKVWAAGMPRESHQPMKVEVGLGLCDKHREEFDPKDIPQLPQIIQDVCSVYKVAPVDTDRLQVAYQPIRENYKSGQRC